MNLPQTRDTLILLAAARNADWGRLEGGTPCFHIEDGRFCFMSEGKYSHGQNHEFVSLEDLLRSVTGKL